jgi:DNA-binding MarR family transcriptional regulator
VKDPLTQLPGYVLRRASAAALARLNEQLAPLSLRHIDVALMLLVEDTPGLTPSRAGSMLDIQRANMAPLAARLENRGLVARRRVDGRSHALELTAKGRALLVRARSIVARCEAELLRPVPVRLRPHVLPILMALWNPHHK